MMSDIFFAYPYRPFIKQNMTETDLQKQLYLKQQDYTDQIILAPEMMNIYKTDEQKWTLGL